MGGKKTTLMGVHSEEPEMVSASREVGFHPEGLEVTLECRAVP